MQDSRAWAALLIVKMSMSEDDLHDIEVSSVVVMLLQVGRDLQDPRCSAGLALPLLQAALAPRESSPVPPLFFALA